jgi:hypothetical protein
MLACNTGHMDVSIDVRTSLNTDMVCMVTANLRVIIYLETVLDALSGMNHMTTES